MVEGHSTESHPPPAGRPSSWKLMIVLIQFTVQLLKLCKYATIVRSGLGSKVFVSFSTPNHLA